MKSKLLVLILVMVFFGCTIVEDDTMISFKGNLVDGNGNPLRDVKIELVTSSFTSQNQLQISGFSSSIINKLDVYDISNEDGKFQFFFPRSNLDLAIYVSSSQNLKFYFEDSEENFPIYILESPEILDSDFGNLILISSE